MPMGGKMRTCLRLAALLAWYGFLLAVLALMAWLIGHGQGSH